MKLIRLYAILFSTLAMASPLKVPTKFYEGATQYPNHPGSAPLITYLTFRSICDHVIGNETEFFDPDLVQQGDTIYVNIWYLEWFHKEVHDQIKHPYILVSCDVGNWLPDVTLQKFICDPKLAAWFCRNILFSCHPKLFQIPMGQTDPFFGHYWLPTLKEMSDQIPFEKKYLLYMNHYPREYGDRDKIVKLFENKPYCFSRNHTAASYAAIATDEYYKELAAATFVISPFGLESDCVRTWEALSLGCIPIIEHSFLDPLFEEMPVLMVHDWKEIDEELLKKKQAEIKGKRWDKAFFSHWKGQIQKVQEKIRGNDLTTTLPEAMKWSGEQLRDLISILQEDENPFLIYKGFLSPIHALQLANEAPFIFTIYLSDPWVVPKEQWFSSQGTLKNLFSYSKDPSLFSNCSKINLISEKQFYADCINYNPFGLLSSPIFLDFSYYRNSISMDFRNFRHHLLTDLEDLYWQMMPEGLLVGNGMEHPYVSEVLDRFSKKHQVPVQRRGQFWFLRRQ